MQLVSAEALRSTATAVISGSSVFRYAQLQDAAAHLATQLSRLLPRLAPGAEVGPRVGLCARPGPEYVAATWAIWQAGGVVVPLATSHPPAELTYVLQDSNCSAVVAPEKDAAALDHIAAAQKAHLVVVEERLLSNSNAHSPRPGPTAGNDAAAAAAATGPAVEDRGSLIMYTSGTTGKPKGVLHTHKSILAQVRSLTAAWGWCPEDVILHALPLHHTHGIVNGLYCPHHVGAAVHFMPSFSPTNVWRQLMTGGVTVFMGVPTMYSHLLSVYDQMPPEEQAAAREAAAKLRLAVSGSAACPVPVMQRWAQLAGRVPLERYGMTEIGMALSNPYKGERRPGFVGQPLPGVHVKIAQARGSEHPSQGTAPPTGELLVKGDVLFKEYWGRPDATREAFDDDGYFKTGDTVSVQGDPPYYKIEGRTSVDILKVGGEKISALDIESALMQHPSVAECVVLGLPDEVYGQRLCALVVPVGDLDSAELQRFCAGVLPLAQVPREFKMVDTIPRNAMGKVNKKALTAEMAAKAS